MVRSIRLFLVRHGETVDNVAQLYAGSRDSALTNHGHQQATRLGLHFKSLGLAFTHLFSSHLQRAATTADLIRQAQLPTDAIEAPRNVAEVVQLPILTEQDFGDLEGKKWADMQAELQNKPGFVAMETKEAMSRRADAFLDEHILPLFGETTDGSALTIAIVSHGIFLSTLWKRLLRRLPANSISLSADLQSTARLSLEHLGAWSNTGFLELLMVRDEAGKAPPAGAATTAMSKPDLLQPTTASLNVTVDAVEPIQNAAQAEPSQVSDNAKVNEAIQAIPATAAAVAHPSQRTTGLRIAHGWTITILTINGKDHLTGLKRTGGGVGSSRHDASQTGIETFFKRRKVD
ncbi:histidine phosphatase superfamily [Boeremia exigua]|uniref:histidine phosphatase superfamily n=1 Tax=Boeremia exigua TaxID=749465 RepID=UPI001E8DAFC1|nr:histidine phosphatase superfamily [Boeremia exigua]KAH6618971.1 histidine phosphatase superfamily [Boeremia exigua]